LKNFSQVNPLTGIAQNFFHFSLYEGIKIMTVQQLIDELKQYDPNKTIKKCDVVEDGNSIEYNNVQGTDDYTFKDAIVIY
jgi:hypothetical protein